MALGRGAGLAPVPPGPCGCFLGREGRELKGSLPPGSLLSEVGAPMPAGKGGCWSQGGSQGHLKRQLATAKERQ